MQAMTIMLLNLSQTVLHLPLASIISLETLQELLARFGYIAVALFIMIESMGVPFPGETMLLLASFYAAIEPRLQIPFVILSAALGAIIGDNIGYYIGRTGGRAFVLRFGRYFFVKPHHLDYAERFFAKHGDKTVFFGRFTAILRTWAAFLAGVNHMKWQHFLFYNAAGGILWSILYGVLGYLGGRVFHDNFDQLEQIASRISWGSAIIVVVIILIAVLLIWRRRQKHKQLEEQTAKQPIESEGTEDTETPINKETALDSLVSSTDEHSSTAERTH